MSLLFAPGPVKVPPTVRKLFKTDPPYFTTPEFSKLLELIQPDLQYVFGTTNPVMIGTGSGSLGMEAAVQNFFSKGEYVIVINTGKYGKNWVNMCTRRGLVVETLNSDLRSPVRPELFGSILAKILKMQGRVDGVFITHTETTTGIRNPIERYLEIIKEISPGTLVLIDAVSSLLTEQLHSFDYDVVISASQKALMLPPGLFFMTASPRALKKAESVENRMYYFDVINENERTAKNITTFTPASDLIPALKVSLHAVVQLGKENVIQECAKLSNIVRQELVRRFKMWPSDPANAVSVFECERANEFVNKMRNMGIVIGGGVRELNNKVFRIMHFGWNTEVEEIEYVLWAIRKLTWW